MSASRRPICSPCACRPRARLQAVVDLPTPPLPDATAITCFTPGMTWALEEGALAGRPGATSGVVAGPFATGRSAVRLANTLLTPGRPLTAVSAALRTRSIAAASAGSIAMENMTRAFWSTTTSERRPEAARLVPAGSTFTVERACSTCSRVIATIHLLRRLRAPREHHLMVPTRSVKASRAGLEHPRLRVLDGGMLREIFTIGYEGANPDLFLTALKDAGVGVIADVRAVALSRKRGFSMTAL